MSEKKNQFYRVDYIKLICSFLVVMIHCLQVPAGHKFSELIVKCFSQQAVPYFFIASGFFFALKADKDNSNKYVLDRVLYLLKSYLIWVLIWSPMIVYRYLKIYKGSSVFYIAMIIFRRVFFAGEGVYWYLLVLAETFFIIYIAKKIKKMNLLTGLSIIMFFLGLYYDYGSNNPTFSKFFSIIYLIFSWSNNVLMRGLPYTLVGYYIAHGLTKENHNSRKLFVFYCILCLINVSIYLMWNNKIYIFFYPAQAIILFLISINKNFNKGNGKYAKECRKVSTVIYLLHTLFIYYVADIAFTIYAPIILKFAIAVIGSFLAYYLVNRSKNNCLKKVLMISGGDG